MLESRAAGWEPAVREALAGLRYGTVTLTIHDARVVQIERSEKIRVADGTRPTGRPAAFPEHP